MKRQRILAGALFLTLLMLSLIAGLSAAQGPHPPRPLAPQVMPGTGFTYQGRLNSGGEPVNDDCQMAFRLYADAGGSIELGAITETVTITEGLFSVVLNEGGEFGTAAFAGHARWLGIRVKCSGDSAFTDLGEQALTPAPMALSLPGLWTEQNSTSPNLIGGYAGSEITGGAVGATIGGGGQMNEINQVGADFGAIGGGRGNSVLGTDAVVAGGWDNIADGVADAVGGGEANWAYGGHSTIAGGQDNVVSATHGTVAGGMSNVVNPLAEYASIGGGLTNDASGILATVGGGLHNQATYSYTTIAGGYDNIADGVADAVGGGEANWAYGGHSTIAGGQDNVVSATHGTVAGGMGNIITSFGDYAFIGGGQQNDAGGIYATIGGGTTNMAGGVYASVGGGLHNQAMYSYTTIAGGYDNYADGNASSIGGGENSRAIGGHSAIAGGQDHVVSATHGTVAGGKGNTIDYGGEYAAIGGGQGNSTNAQHATVAGGWDNFAGGNRSSIGGGEANNAYSAHSTIGGGQDNVAAASHSTIPGGFAAGASHYGEMAYASGSFASTGDAQTSIYVLRATTATSETRELFLDGTSLRITIPQSRTVTFDILIAAAAENGDVAGWEYRGLIAHTSVTGTFIVGTPSSDNWATTGAAGWTATHYADNTNHALTIHVRCNSDRIVRWVATVRTVELDMP